MTDLYAPNGRKVEGIESPAELVRLRGAGYSEQPPTQLEVAQTFGQPAVAFDPAEHTVDEVKAFTADHPELTEAVVTAEKSGKNRSSLA